MLRLIYAITLFACVFIVDTQTFACMRLDVFFPQAGRRLRRLGCNFKQLITKRNLAYCWKVKRGGENATQKKTQTQHYPTYNMSATHECFNKTHIHIKNVCMRRTHTTHTQKTQRRTIKKQRCAITHKHNVMLRPLERERNMDRGERPTEREREREMKSEEVAKQ